MALLKENSYTTDDIYALPEGQRAELIDGQIYDLAAPSRNHQQISRFLERKIEDYIDEKGGDCEVYHAPFAVFLNKDNKTYVEPDIILVCDTDKLEEDGCHGAPDWIIEIVSPGSKRMDYMIKLFKYRSAGVREYWVADPTEGAITVYDFENENRQRCTFAEKISSCIFEDLEIDFSTFV